MRITDFPELIAPTGNDLLVTVDIANDLTKKVKLDNLPISLPALTALATKQDSLVSGVTIKTVNSQSLLGAGDIPIPIVNPSGVSGAIQFSNGSAFASDASNFFWDDTNNRLGVGTNVPTQALDVVGEGRFSGNILFTTDVKFIGCDINRSSFRFASSSSEIRANITTGGKFEVYNAGSGSNRFAVSSGGQTTISGGGTTSATTSLLVQNSAGRTALKVADNGVVTIGADDKSGEQLAFVGLYGTRLRILTNSSVDGITGSVINSALDFTSNDLILSSKAASTTSNVYVIPTSFTSLSGSVLVNTTTDVASSVLTVNSTTKGVLFPRMTTTQKNAIASPAAGLVVYDSTTNKLCCYNGSTWNDLF
jgi:hypothetical protein